MSSVQKLIDPETLEFLDKQREGDMQIVADIGSEQKHIEFRYGHAERFNQWKSEELHIDRANFKEAAFLEKIHDEEESSIVAHQVYFDVVTGIFFKKRSSHQKIK